MANKWKLYQYDVKNAFVHAKIDAEIYVEQPIGQERYYNKNNNTYELIKTSNNNNNSKLYCKLNKALYGLK